MNTNGTSTVRTSPKVLWLAFFLMFAGLSISTLGFRYRQTLLVIMGMIFVTVTMFAFRSTIRKEALAGALVGMFVGASIGAGMGLTIGSVAESLVGIVGGAVIGAEAGMILVAAGLGILREVLPTAVLTALLTIGALAGGLVGVSALRETIMRVFGPIGGGTIAMGSLGIAVGLFMGHRVAAAAEEWLASKRRQDALSSAEEAVVNEKELFPWDDVEVERNRSWLQEKHSLEEAKHSYLSRAKPCPECKIPADELSWIYYRIPRRLLRPPRAHRRAGWLTACNQCNLQVDFFLWEQELVYWSAVNLSRDDDGLQSQHSVVDAKERFLEDSPPCPRCMTAADGLLWVYYRDLEEWPRRKGWLSVCEPCNIQVDFFLLEQQHFPWEEVNEARAAWDKSLASNDRQSQMKLEEAKTRYLESAAPCPNCGKPADGLSWFCYSSPRETWDALAGRLGWMTVCDECNNQVDFFLEVMS